MTAPRPGSAVVVGGGLAGLAAALTLADAGVSVTLLEARSRLGGAASSFTRDGYTLDTGQHVFLGCCTAYRGLLRRLGVEASTCLQRRLDIPVILGDRAVPARTRMRRSRLPLPPPLHLAGALLGFGALPLPDRLRAVRAAAGIGRLDPADPRLDLVSFAAWLGGQRQSPRSQRDLWGLLTVAALNAPPDRASLALAAKVVQTGLLERRDGADIGTSAVPLAELHDAAARRALHAAGARVHARVKVRQVLVEPDGFRIDADGAVARADAVVLAVPPAVAASLLPPGAAPDLSGLVARGSVPIVNVHVFYDRPVLDTPFVAAVGSPVQWVFDRTVAAGVDRGQYVAVSLSAAADWVGRPTAELAATFVPELARLLPAAARARVDRVLVTREPAATFDQSPGQLAARPPVATSVPRMAVAGAWTRTGWPATMEGAVRSGRAAAAHLLGEARSPAGLHTEGVAA